MRAPSQCMQLWERMSTRFYLFKQYIHRDAGVQQALPLVSN